MCPSETIPSEHVHTRDGDLSRLEGAMARVAADPGPFPDVEAIAEAAGFGSTKLKNLFREHAQTQPAAFLQRMRIQAACAHLAAGLGDGPTGGMGVGSEGSPGFPGAFRRQTGLSVDAYKAMLHSDRFTLPMPTGLRVADVLAFHGRDGLSASERVVGRRLSKAFLDEGRACVLKLDFQDQAIEVSLVGALGPRAMARAHEAGLRLLGWHGDPTAFETAHPEMARGREGLRVLLTLDPFEALVWAILGQQVNLAFAYALRRDLIRLAGVAAAEGLIAHPDAPRVAALTVEALQGLRCSRRKAEYLLNAAQAVAEGRLRLDGRGTATGASRDILALRGCGPWTSQYVLMRGLGFEDGVPVGDSGLTLALQRWFTLDARPDEPETLRLMEAFAPHRSLATFHLWASLKGTPA